MKSILHLKLIHLSLAWREFKSLATASEFRETGRKCANTFINSLKFTSSGLQAHNKVKSKWLREMGEIGSKRDVLAEEEWIDDTIAKRIDR